LASHVEDATLLKSVISITEEFKDPGHHLATGLDSCKSIIDKCHVQTMRIEYELTEIYRISHSVRCITYKVPEQLTLSLTEAHIRDKV